MNAFGDTLAGHAVELLADEARRGRLCIVVGAGVSCDLQAPTWRQLAGALVSGDEERRGEDGGEDRRERRDLPPGVDPSLALELSLRTNSREGIDKVRRELYRGLKRSWTSHRVRHLGGRSDSAVALVAKLLIRIATNGEDRRARAISYNFDTFLEEAISDLGHRVQAVTPRRIETWSPRFFGARDRYLAEGRPLRPSFIRVYHPHGLLPRSERENPITTLRREVHPEELTLTSADYDRNALESMSERSLPQLVTFGSRGCLFYGFSFADSGVRRLLRQSARAGALPYGPGEGPEVRHVALLQGNEMAGARLGDVPASPYHEDADRSVAAPRESISATLAWGWRDLLCDLGIIPVLTRQHEQQKSFVREVLRLSERTSARRQV